MEQIGTTDSELIIIYKIIGLIGIYDMIDVYFNFNNVNEIKHLYVNNFFTSISIIQLIIRQL